MLDIEAINAWILCKKPTNKGISIRNFLLELIDALTQKHLETSPEIPAPACSQLSSRKRKKCRGSDGCANATVSLCIICKCHRLCLGILKDQWNKVTQIPALKQSCV